jgi:hypothetical protein
MSTRPVWLVLACIAGCAPLPPGTAPAPSHPVAAASSAPLDTGALIPAGLGTLRQTDVAIMLDLTNVSVWLIPMDESVIRTLAPDTYRSLSTFLRSKRADIQRRAQADGLVEQRLWYVTFNGLAPNATFTPTDITITAQGRDFRPVEIIPLSLKFDEQRLQPGESLKALYLFPDGLDVSQPLTVTIGTVQNTSWGDTILQLVQREQTAIRARKPPPA